ncbi:MAG: DUF3566 domain-containing protein [Nitriliruptoraceae bacterium]
MARRRLTVKHLDPWSVLKFGVLANIAITAILLVGIMVVWFIVDRLGIVDQVCGIAIDIGFTQCGLNTSNLFRASLTVGLLWVVVQTAVMVFLAFLYNLIADLTGGVAIIAVDEAVPSPRGGKTGGRFGASSATGHTPSTDEPTSNRSRRSLSGTAGSHTAAIPSTDTGKGFEGSGRRPGQAAGESPIDRTAKAPSGNSATTPPRTESGEPAQRSQPARRPSTDDGDELFGSR